MNHFMSKCLQKNLFIERFKCQPFLYYLKKIKEGGGLRKEANHFFPPAHKS